MARKAAAKKPTKAPAKKPPAKKPAAKEEGKKDRIFSPSMVNLLATRLDKIESKTGMMSNTVKYLQPHSFGLLSTDLLFNGGLYAGFSSIAGQEQSGKTLTVNHSVASSLDMTGDQLFTFFIDGEGALSPELAASIYKMHGIDYSAFVDSRDNPLARYYRENVIETTFDLMKAWLDMFPKRMWIEKENTWAYVFKKRDANDKLLMSAYGVKDSKALNTESKFVCPTDNNKVVGIICIDSLASMLTERDEDNEERSKIRAAEAQAFSLHLKRVSSKLSSVGAVLLGTNQIRKNPNANFGNPEYEPCGDAVKFYTHQRARLASRVTGFTSTAKREKEGDFFYEPSVFNPKRSDRYAFKAMRNTKNKPGNPNKRSWMRVWVADHEGNPRGIDPFYDTYMYLLDTHQINRRKGGSKKNNLAFNLHKSVGKAALRLNDSSGFNEFDLKTLILGEFFGTRELMKTSSDKFGFSKAPKLREALFNQMKTYPDIKATGVDTVEEDDEDDFDVEL